jgi:hypothetical protein
MEINSLTVGVVFYREKASDLNVFFSYLQCSIDRAIKVLQTNVNFVFVFNDGHNETYLSVLTHLKTEFKFPFKILINEKNNIGQARQMILVHSDTPLVYFTDPDVFQNEESLKNIFSSADLLKENNIIGITGPLEHVFKLRHMNLIFQALSWAGSILQLSFQGVAKQRLLVDHAPTAHLLLNKSKALSVGGFRSQFERFGEDLDFSHRCTILGYAFHFSQSKVIHNQSIPFLLIVEKFFKYGRAQTLVFMENGLIKNRCYRLLPMFLLVLATMVLFAIGFLVEFDKPTYTIVFISTALGLTYLINPPLVYGAGTIYEFFRGFFNSLKKHRI